MRACDFCERLHNYPTVIIDTHHKLSRFFGGSDTKENVIDLCRQCHRVFEYMCDDGTGYSVTQERWR